jgi:hypothetical protein
LRRRSHASFVASKTEFSFATVWRVAERAGIELTAGREAKGYKRLAPERVAEVIEARRMNPNAAQIEIATSWCQLGNGQPDRARRLSTTMRAVNSSSAPRLPSVSKI